ncbi:MAG: hypothetical protein ACLRWG_04070 [Streptococcus salivarius]|uniref:hypothetical protein n=1 Tax=Streptococcus salivarius TaxID=1304 RepID=UPI00321A1E8C
MKNNRLWIESKIGSAAEKVYPTKNLYELFDTFPKGFTIRVSDSYRQNGDYYTRLIYLYGRKEKTITGKVTLTIGQDKKVDESELIYSNDGELQLVNHEFSSELLPYKTFLFQNLTLNKKGFSMNDIISKSYNWEIEEATIKYKVKNKNVNQILDIDDNDTVTMEVVAKPELLSGQQYTLPIIYYQDIDKRMHSENIIDSVREDKHD